ncbi:DUF317 domain-containing protein [Streptomyces sp. NPDC019890]|uniref:DUF317 domain-containing protein n=1 Tax=Streptomyces sp. NPDC019890 TaxID=3365064 RepID=UPI00384F8FB4
MTERQLAAFADDHRYKMQFDTSPRYLAGPGDARHVTHALSAAGWTNHSDPASPTVRLTSPDYQVRLQLDPQSSTSAWWRLTSEPIDGPGWCAEFGELVPAEILAGLTDALTSPAPDSVPGVWPVLAAAGWTCILHEDGTGQALSPDQHLRVQRVRYGEGDGSCIWRAEASGTEAYELPIWHAWLRDTIPAHLLTGFAAALAGPEPVQRGMYDRTGHHSVTQERSTLTGEQVVAAHISRLDAVRARARTARRRQKLSAHASPAPARPVATPAARSR